MMKIFIVIIGIGGILSGISILANPKNISIEFRKKGLTVFISGIIILLVGLVI